MLNHIRNFVSNCLSGAKKKTIIPKAVIIPRTAHTLSQGDISHNALKVITHLSKNKHQAFLVGGSVRDLLLRKKPKDFDVATSATPNQIKRIFKNARLIGRRFKLAHIYFRKEIIEVATFRSNSDERSQKTQTNNDGMIVCDNEFGNLESDVWRRDFTINALYYCPNRRAIIDYTGGVKDVESKTIRIIGDANVRFSEDPVRMIRAIRFASTLGFSIEPKTEQAIQQCAELIQGTSNSRLFEEVVKLFHSGAGNKVFLSLIENNLFPHLFPQTSEQLSNIRCKGLIQQTLKNTDQRIKVRKPVTPAFIFASLLWHPMLEHAKHHRSQGAKRLESYERAIVDVFRMQNQITHIPKRFTQYIREMWFLQTRFSKRQGTRAYRLISHPRFRAAFDLYVLRAEIGETNKELVDWWTEFQFASHEQQQEMVSEL